MSKEAARKKNAPRAKKHPTEDKAKPEARDGSKKAKVIGTILRR